MLTLLWGQRPTEGDGGEVDERDLPERIHLNVEKPVFAPELVQRVRKEKASRERAYIKRQLSGAHIERPKTFQVSLEKSRFAPIKRIMEQIRGESSVQSVETGSRRLAITQQKDKKEVQTPALLKD